MKNAKRMFLLSAVVVVALVLGLAKFASPAKSAAGGSAILVYCAAGIKAPVQELATQFEQDYGVRVHLQFGGSGTLLSNLQVSQQGDLYLSADVSYQEIARAKGLVRELVPLAFQKPVIAVHKGNPRQIRGLADLARSDVRVALGNPEAASIGKQTQKLLTASGHWAAVAENVTQNGVFKPTVPEVANDISLASVDAGIIWDATARQYDDIELIQVPELDLARKEIMIGVLTQCTQPTHALRFARYLNSTVGNAVFAAHHYETVAGDRWEWEPQMTFFSGTVNRRGIDRAVLDFAEREGVSMNVIYNGCGLLTGQMRTIRASEQATGFPDAYMACDRYYLDVVADWFKDDSNISENRIVIAVPKGNPAKIATLGDLAKPGVRVALGQPQQCTIGVLTRKLLEEQGLLDAITANVVTETASSALLVPAIATGHADAAIAYETDTLAEVGKIDSVVIESQLARAVQPFSISRSSVYQHLSERLRAAIVAHRDDLEAAGFVLQPGPEK
ncbi:MAG TPA: molybdate ABC transporter substrate-binding protein [Lentisphaeria bacterium]|nr:molybdate ABC transporter substrate-binding protein [Lentisphaeria bacterium]